MSVTKTLIITLSIALASHAAFKYLYKKKPKKRKEINDVIMFSNKSGDLKPSKYLKHQTTENIERLLHYLNQPRYSLDICMYVLTNTDITNAILKQHYRGVKVRVIVDPDMAFTSGSTVKRLEKQGIPVRWMKSTDIMHHKFCIIDALGGEAVTPFVMTGSLNWTTQALYKNWENLLITSEREIVEPYSREFERLWLEFRPIVRIGK
ncbi:mitochondrial cardiolipin hydrolase-like [Zerene cesonia]|uniref:mitochondrial cardiolipin hydrolase-like n=1 Tax=Zerene cesonia TaxID=33412 RepID=UPI0018E4E3E4|nr:mitochondrial cardiolipin hydrolase-like [Zerene cesonia]